MFRVAILADLHLPDIVHTVKEGILDWALDEARRCRVDLIVGAGDLTGSGRAAAAHRIRAKLEAARIPFLLTPGNAERRSPGESEQVLAILKTADEHGPVRLIDTSNGRIPEADRLRLRTMTGEHLLVVTHVPVEDLAPEDRCLWNNRAIGLVVAGHCHHDLDGDGSHRMRGLDPDKAIGGPPSFAVFTRDGEGPWTREDVAYDRGDPRCWPVAERREWLAHLGVSGMEMPLESLRHATESGVRAFEFRYHTIATHPVPALIAAVAAWRGSGGTYLSLHLPDLRWNTGAVVGLEELRDAVELALTLGSDSATCHVPRLSVGEFASARDGLLRTAKRALAPLRQAGITLGVENLHMTGGEQDNPGRGFGYTPEECRQWIELLRTGLDYPKIGLHLDIGHARNNAPYSSRYPLSSWYALHGREITGFHLHQVRKTPAGSFENHAPLTGLFGALISLSSLFLAWRDGSIRHAPMYLEIRGEPGLDSFRALRRDLGLDP